MIGVRCPQCQAEFSVKPKFVGKTMRCRKCRGPVPVPPPGWTGEPLPPASEWSTFWSYLGGTIVVIALILSGWERLTRHSRRAEIDRQGQERMQEGMESVELMRRLEEDRIRRAEYWKRHGFEPKLNDPTQPEPAEPK